MSAAPEHQSHGPCPVARPTATETATAPPVAPFPLARRPGTPRPTTRSVRPSGGDRPSPALVVRRLPVHTIESRTRDLPTAPRGEDLEQLSRVTTAWEEAATGTASLTATATARELERRRAVEDRRNRADSALLVMVEKAQMAEIDQEQPPFGTLDGWLTGLRQRLDPTGPPDAWAPQALTRPAPATTVQASDETDGPDASDDTDTVHEGLSTDEADRVEFAKLVEAGKRLLAKAKGKADGRQLKNKGDKDRDDWFRTRYRTAVSRDVNGPVQVNTGPIDGSSYLPPYQNVMAPGTIQAKWNFRLDRDSNIEEERPRKPEKPAPPPDAPKKTWALPNSEILWQQYRQAGFEPRDLRLVSRMSVMNTTTVRAMDLAEAYAPGGVYRPGSDGFHALIGTPNCAPVVWLLVDHAKALEGAEVAEIQVRGSDIHLHLTRSALPREEAPEDDHQAL